MSALLLESGDFILIESGENLLIEAPRMNQIILWRGAVEPAETSASGNEYKAWGGAVEPAYVAPIVPPSKRGSSSKRSLRELVELPDGTFVQVFSQAEADQIRANNQPDQEPEPSPERQILRMTPEVRAMINRYNKNKKNRPAVPDGGLVGKRRGLTE